MKLYKNKVLILFIIGILAFITIIFLSQEKNITIVINGIKLSRTTNSITVSQELDALKNEYDFKDFTVELPENKLLKNKDILKINTAKNVNITINGKEFVFTTYKNTTKEFLIDNGYTLEDNTVYFGDFAKYDMLKAENYLEVATQKISEEAGTVTRDVGEVVVEDPNKLAGTKTVKEGSPEVVKQKYKIIYRNGVEVERILLEEDLVQSGSAKVVTIGTKKAPSANYAAGDTVWDDLAKCEAGGNWAINTGNGYTGGLQFAPSTWAVHAAKVGVSATLASEASREEQILVGQSVQQSQGWGAWPSCAKKLGLY